MDLAARLMKLLGSAGVETILTRASDIYVSLYDRVAIANKENADFFLSLHINAGGGSGFESYRYPGSELGLKYQQAIHSQVARYILGYDMTAAMFEAEQPDPYILRSMEAAGDYVYELPDRGMKAARYYVLKNTKMPAVLLECLFIDNPKDAACLKDSAFMDGLANAIANGVLDITPQDTVEELRRINNELRQEIQAQKQQISEMEKALRQIAGLSAKWL